VEWAECNIVNNTCYNALIYQVSGVCLLTRCIFINNKNESGSSASQVGGGATLTRVNCSSDTTDSSIPATNTLPKRDLSLCWQFYSPTADFIDETYSDSRSALPLISPNDDSSDASSSSFPLLIVLSGIGGLLLIVLLVVLVLWCVQKSGGQKLDIGSEGEADPRVIEFCTDTGTTEESTFHTTTLTDPMLPHRL
jgi:hypothetical protein